MWREKDDDGCRIVHRVFLPTSTGHNQIEFLQSFASKRSCGLLCNTARIFDFNGTSRFFFVFVFRSYDRKSKRQSAFRTMLCNILITGGTINLFQWWRIFSHYSHWPRGLCPVPICANKTIRTELLSVPHTQSASVPYGDTCICSQWHITVVTAHITSPNVM